MKIKLLFGFLSLFLFQIIFYSSYGLFEVLFKPEYINYVMIKYLGYIFFFLLGYSFGNTYLKCVNRDFYLGCLLKNFIPDLLTRQIGLNLESNATYWREAPMMLN